ncbi:hypothetical protein FSST1_001186 [Fusarium sambucinum]
MDGLSIATACFAFIEIADKTFKVISDFVKDCKDARNDLAAVNQELLALKRTLNLLKDLVSNGDERDLTINTKRDIRDIIQNSLGIASTLEDELRGQQGRLLAVNWATRGKRKVATYQVILETNRRALSLAVETITLATAKDIKQDTRGILDDTGYIRGGISAIMLRIHNLEALLTRQESDDPHTFMLTRYLNELSSVAGSVCDPLSRPASPAPSKNSSNSGVSHDTDTRESSPPENTPLASIDKGIPQVSQSEDFGKTSVDSVLLSPYKLSLLKHNAYQLQQSHFISRHLQIEQETHPTGLSSDGNKLVWLQRGKTPDNIYDIESKQISNVTSLGIVDRLRQSMYKVETGLAWNYKVLPSSRDSTLHHVTLSRDGKNVTGLLGDAQQSTACIWDLPLEWFADKHVVAFPEIQPPVTVGLQQKDLTVRERTLGLASNGQNVVVIRGGIGTRTNYHAGFRNAGLKAIAFSLETGVEISSYSLPVSHFHGDDSKDSFFTDARISADGKLLRTRIARTPGLGRRSASEFRRETWTDIETIVLKVKGLEIVHRFKEVWNAIFTEPVTLSIFAPNFDVLARLVWKRTGEENRHRVWLEVYGFKEPLEEE